MPTAKQSSQALFSASQRWGRIPQAGSGRDKLLLLHCLPSSQGSQAAPLKMQCWESKPAAGRVMVPEQRRALRVS
jgi:hypothetical protein